MLGNKSHLHQHPLQLTIDQKRAEPALDEQLECAMDYDFNLKCIIKLLQTYRDAADTDKTSTLLINKRINQLINHSQYSSFNIDKGKYTDQLKIMENLYALGLSELANDTEEIRNSLRMGLNTSQDVIRDIINSISSKQYRGHNALLMHRVIDVLSIAAYGKR